MSNEKNISYFKGKNELKIDIDSLKNEIAQFLQLDNLNFLLRAGCSSYIKNDEELGIPGMAKLYEGFFKQFKGFQIAGSDAESIFDGNLEKMLETMEAIAVAAIVKQTDNDIEKKFARYRNILGIRLLTDCMERKY